MERNAMTKLARRLTISPHQMVQNTGGRPPAAEAKRWRRAVRTGGVDLPERERHPLPVQLLEAEPPVERERGRMRGHHLELDGAHAAPARLLDQAREQRPGNSAASRLGHDVQLFDPERQTASLDGRDRS